MAVADYVYGTMLRSHRLQHSLAQVTWRARLHIGQILVSERVEATRTLSALGNFLTLVVYSEGTDNLFAMYARRVMVQPFFL
jgi:hypothetical protein